MYILDVPEVRRKTLSCYYIRIVPTSYRQISENRHQTTY